MKFTEWKEKLHSLQVEADEKAKAHQESLLKLNDFIKDTLGMDLSKQTRGVDELATLASKVFEMHQQ